MLDANTQKKLNVLAAIVRIVQNPEKKKCCEQVKEIAALLKTLS